MGISDLRSNFASLNGKHIPFGSVEVSACEVDFVEEIRTIIWEKCNLFT